MPTFITHRADGGIDARNVPRDIERLPIPAASDGQFMVGLLNLATNVAAPVEVTNSRTDETAPVTQPLIGSTGELVATTTRTFAVTYWATLYDRSALLNLLLELVVREAMPTKGGIS